MRVIVEVPRWTRTKYHHDGTVDYTSPLPCPFNYGSVPETVAPDGDPEDAIVLGPRRARGALIDGSPSLRVRFLDDGIADDKWVFGTPTLPDRLALSAFFRLYAVLKRARQRWDGRGGRTAYLGTFPASQADISQS
jgi:inorganic pyrophosphatase